MPNKSNIGIYFLFTDWYFQGAGAGRHNGDLAWIAMSPRQSVRSTQPRPPEPVWLFAPAPKRC